MSQSHIPQPNAIGAPSEEVLSTDSAQQSPTVSAIGVPGPDPSEAPTHMGASNTIDTVLYMQQIFCATFPWTTKDQPGKLLFKLPITPSKINKIISLLSRIYNGWSGGFEFMAKIAGTGFHAGALTLVRFPPNIDPEDYSGTKDWSAFEWVLFDPKMLEVASITIRDQRPTNYHYVVPETETPASWDIAGYLGVFVDMSLNTSSSGSQSIQVQLWARPAQDFRFMQLKVPRDIPSQDTSIIPFEIALALDFSTFRYPTETCASFPYSPDKLIVAPSTVKLVQNGIYNTFTLAGRNNSKFQKPDEYVPPGYEFTAKINNATTIDFPNGYWDIAPVNGGAITLRKNSTIIGGATMTNIVAGQWQVVIDPFNEGEFEIGTEISVDTWEPTDRFFYTDDTALVAKTNVESFVLFQSRFNSSLTTIQTTTMARIFKSAKYATWLPAGSCALFVMIDTSENLPIGYAKLYQEGFITTAASEDKIEYPLQNIRFNFSNFIQRTDQMPVSPSYAQNKLLLLMKYRALNKRSSRKHRQ